MPRICALNSGPLLERQAPEQEDGGRVPRARKELPPPVALRGECQRATTVSHPNGDPPSGLQSCSLSSVLADGTLPWADGVGSEPRAHLAAPTGHRTLRSDGDHPARLPPSHRLHTSALPHSAFPNDTPWQPAPASWYPLVNKQLTQKQPRTVARGRGRPRPWDCGPGGLDSAQEFRGFAVLCPLPAFLREYEGRKAGALRLKL